MPQYIYKIVTKKNQVVRGTINAISGGRAKKKLEQDGSTLLLLYAEKSSSLLHRDIPLPFGGFSGAERMNFFRDLAMMIAAGVPLMEILEIIQEQIKSSRVRNALHAMVDDIKNGQQLSTAMAKHPAYFSHSIVETVRAGELSGRLSETLDKISVDLEKDDELRKKVVGAMAYPAIVTLVMLVVAAGLILYVLPQIAELFEDLEAPMPLPTRVLLYGSAWAASHPLALLGAVAGIVFAFWGTHKNRKGRYAMHYATLLIPIIGPLLKEYNIVLFFRSLEALAASGISLPRAVEVAKNTLQNDVYKHALAGAGPLLLHGIPLSETLIPHPKLFPRSMQKIVSVGERTGKLEDMFRRITAYYERSVDHRTRLLTVLLEPILMLLIGGVVGSIALSIFLPIYGAANAL